MQECTGKFHLLSYYLIQQPFEAITTEITSRSMPAFMTFAVSLSHVIIVSMYYPLPDLFLFPPILAEKTDWKIMH